MKKILLHICCGICAGSVVEKLREENFKVIGFFYNPNIHPQEEYEKRLEVAYNVSKILDFELIEGSYDKNNWFKLTENLKEKLEGGERCEVCFSMRLEKTCKKSKKLNIPFFTTTLSVSPYKNSSAINRIGTEIDKKCFLERDFKKKDGFKKSVEFSKKYNLYRQNYCGCIYSMDKSMDKS